MGTSTPRKISVDGQSYRWRVTVVDAKWIRLRLWKDGVQQPWADVGIGFTDPWLSLPDAWRDEPADTPPVTPGRVAEVIRYLNEKGLAGPVDLLGP